MNKKNSRNKKKHNQKQNKKKFSVGENETISDCLERMKQEGYMPTRRAETPVFKENNGQTVYSHQEIVFEGRRIQTGE